MTQQSAQKRELKAVLFDLDGVLVDTSELHANAWAEMARNAGATPPDDIKDQVRGISRMESLKIALGEDIARFSDDELNAMATAKNARYLEMVQNLTGEDLLPGVVELFNDLDDAGIKIVLCSASKNARVVLEGVGIVDRFLDIADGHSYDRGKPHPDVFWTGAKMAGAEPDECIVVEDAAAGITAALDGGFVALGMGHPELLAEAHHLINDLSEVSAASLREIHAKFAPGLQKKEQ
jgi:beta-phosphoglucomutase